MERILNRGSDISTLEQHITVSGYGSEIFKESAVVLEYLIDKLTEGVATLENNDIGHSGDQTISLHCRYLERPRNDGSEHIQISDKIDPQGVLRNASAQGRHFVHTEDNIVEYHRLTANPRDTS